MIGFSKKREVLDCFLANINTYQRVNVVIDRLHDYFYTENGKDYNPDCGKQLLEYLHRLDDTASAIESQPRDYSLLSYVK